MPDGSRLMPNWPRALSAQLAANYVGLSVTSFREHVAADVQPVRLTPGRLAWLREDLDRWLDARRLTVAPSEDADPFLS